jgi:hypothetical protein
VPKTGTYPITSKWNSEERLEVARDYSSLEGGGVGGAKPISASSEWHAAHKFKG